MSCIFKNLVTSLICSTLPGLYHFTALGQYRSFEEITELAQQIALHQPSTQWEVLFPDDDADILKFLGKDSLLAGSIEVNNLGIPKHKNLYLYNAQNGELIWENSRPSVNSASSQILLQTPVILIMAKHAEVTEFNAYQITTGEKIWEKKAKSPVTQAVASNHMFITSRKGKTLQKLDVLTGETIWETALDPTVASDNGLLQLTLLDDLVAVLGKGIQVFDWDGSEIQKTSFDPRMEQDYGYRLLGNKILFYNGSFIWLYDAPLGKELMVLEDTSHVNINLALYQNRIIRVYTSTSLSPDSEPSIGIQSLDNGSGITHWKTNTAGVLVSPILIHNNQVIFSTDKYVYSLGITDGEMNWSEPFALEFVAQAPNSLKMKGQPDILRIRKEKLFISRELYGIACHELRSGKLLWDQPNINPPKGVNPYYVSSSNANPYNSMALHGMINPEEMTEPFNFYDYSKPLRINHYMEFSQRNYEYTMASTQRVIDNPNSSRLQREAAYQERISSIESQISGLENSIAMERTQASLDLALAAVNAVGAIMAGLQQAANLGLVTRINMEMSSAMNMQKICFQGDYHLRPFIHRGLGVTLVNLENGLRSDLIYGPYVRAIDDFGLDLPTFTIDSHQNTLVLVGPGLKTENYVKQKKWKQTFPQVSILTYQIADLEFTESNPIVEKCRKEQIRKASGQPAEFLLHMATSIVDLEQMGQLIFDGADLEEQFQGGLGTPLSWAATMGHNQAILLLLEHGANINSLMDSQSITPLMMAATNGHVETVKLLLEKGADPTIKADDGTSIFKLLKAIPDKAKRKELEEILKEAQAK